MLKKVLVAVFILLTCYFDGTHARSKGYKKSYSGYKVFQVQTSGANDVEILQDLFEKLRVDVWKHPSPNSPHFDVMVGGGGDDAFRRSLELLNKSASPWIDDVQQLIDDANKHTRKRHRRQSRKFRYDEYHNYREILRWMRRFSRSNSDIVSIFQVGTTYEGRRIIGMKIGVDTGVVKPVLWQDSLIHAREWITGATLLWVANRLVEGYRRGEEDIVRLLVGLDFVMLPVWNVDGYKYTWNKERLWRKSRSKIRSNGCKGVDLNRNFYTPMRGGGSSSDYICSGVYHGTNPFSEAETASVAAFLRNLPLVAFVSVHSFSQYWLFPFGYTTEPSPDYADLEEISQQAVRAIEDVHGTNYIHGSVSDVVYKVSGGSVDWVHSTLCVKYAFGVELRDRGRYGFILPPDYIVPTAEEYFAALRLLANHVIGSNSTRSTICGAES